MNNKFKKLTLILGDIFILYLSLYLTLVIRYKQGPSQELWQAHFTPFSITFICWIIIFYILSLYNLKIAVNNSKFFKTVAQGSIISILISVLFFYLYPISEIAPKTNLAIFIIVFMALFIIWRRLFNWTLKSYLPKTNIAFIGRNKQVEEIIKELKKDSHLGYHISFILDSEEKQLKEINGVPIFQNINELKNLIAKKRVNNIILATYPENANNLRSILFDCLPFKISYTNLSNFYEQTIKRVPIEAINKMWFLENLSEGNKNGFDILKRIYDIILSIIIFLTTLVFFPIIATIIKLESNGPVFFIQIRTGKNGKNFKIIKFRTMKINENNNTPTEINDSRITSFGNFLRKTRIDEFPQLINIIKGEMSFVGPRPEQPKLIETLKEQVPFYKERMLVKPGITGWDQISGQYHSPSYEDTMKKLQYDLYYIKNRSIYLDLSILLKTLKTIISKTGR